MKIPLPGPGYRAAMVPNLFSTLLLFLLFLVFPHDAGAADLSFLAGVTESPDLDGNSYGWQVDFRQRITRPFSFSVSWINEGHLPDHHRDGLAGQAWGETSLSSKRLSIGIGAGIYRYFDTEARPGGEHANVHGYAPVYSISAAYRPDSPWFLRLLVNRVHPSRDIDTTAVLLGLGYHLWEEGGEQDRKSVPGPEARYPDSTGTELACLLGTVVHNSLESRQGIAGEIGIRKGIADHLDVSLSWIGEDNGNEIRRSGLGGRIWVVDDFLGSRLLLGLGAGPYPFIDGRPAEGGRGRLDFAVLVSLSAGYRFDERWTGRFIWNRAATRDNRDTDMFVLGLGYRWNR